MATVNVEPVGITTGTPVLGSPAIGLSIAVAPAPITTGAPTLGVPNVAVLPETWPYPAMVPASETLDWLTDVLPGRTGEQRLALRSAPRQSLAYTSRLSEEQFARARDFAKRRAATVIGVPMWHEAVELRADLLATDDTIAIDTTSGDWRVDGGVMVWESPEKFAVARVMSITAGELGLLGPVGQDFSRPKIVPVRRAQSQGFSPNRQATYIDVQAKARVTENVDLSRVSDYPKYLDLDVVTEPQVIVTNISESIVWPVEEIDNGFGPVAIETVRDYVDFGQTLSFMEDHGAALWRRRCWLHSLRGKQKPFWLPSFNPDLEAQAPIGAAAVTATVKATDPATPYVGKHIMLQTRTGTRFMRQITGAVASGANVILTISASLGQSVAVNQIALFCFLSKVRLNADSVSIDHRFTTKAVVSVPVVEVPA